MQSYITVLDPGSYNEPDHLELDCPEIATKSDGAVPSARAGWLDGFRALKSFPEFIMQSARKQAKISNEDQLLNCIAHSAMLIPSGVAADIASDDFSFVIKGYDFTVFTMMDKLEEIFSHWDEVRQQAGHGGPRPEPMEQMNAVLAQFLLKLWYQLTNVRDSLKVLQCPLDKLSFDMLGRELRGRYKPKFLRQRSPPHEQAYNMFLDFKNIFDSQEPAFEQDLQDLGALVDRVFQIVGHISDAEVSMFDIEVASLIRYMKASPQMLATIGPQPTAPISDSFARKIVKTYHTTTKYLLKVTLPLFEPQVRTVTADAVDPSKPLVVAMHATITRYWVQKRQGRAATREVEKEVDGPNGGKFKYQERIVGPGRVLIGPILGQLTESNMTEMALTIYS